MYTQSDLTAEIQDVLETMADTRAWAAEWITHAVLARHQDFQGEDSDFYLCMARHHVHTAVRKHLNRFKLKPEIEPDRQILLEGFQRLQQRYVIMENDEETFVRIQDLTRQQLLMKARELYAMGAGCYEHGDEIMRFVADKFGDEAGAA